MLKPTRLLRTKLLFLKSQLSIAGVGNSFGVAGHISDKLDIRGTVHVLQGKKIRIKLLSSRKSDFNVLFNDEDDSFCIIACIKNQNSYLFNLKWYLRATYRCLAGQSCPGLFYSVIPRFHLQKSKYLSKESKVTPF
jgi:hypothetical protein